MEKLAIPFSNTVVVIPDSHAHPDFDNNRFTLLGKFINTLTQQHSSGNVLILNLGDMADMPSLSSYDKGKKSFEGRRYKRDVASIIDAQEKLFTAAQLDRARVPVRTVLLLGNHDQGRISKFCELHPELDGAISIDDLKYNDYWDKVVNFKDTININGVVCSHYFTSGVKGMPISGENPARQLLLKNHMSSIQGHSHTWDLKEMSNRQGSKLFGLVAGCWVHPKMVEGWNKDTVHFWDNSITVLRNVHKGTYESLSKYSMEYLTSVYK